MMTSRRTILDMGLPPVLASPVSLPEVQNAGGGWEVLGIDLNRSESSRSSEQSWPCGKAVSLWLEVGSLEELGAAFEIACDKSRERLRGLRHRFNAERRKAPLSGQIFHRAMM